MYKEFIIQNWSNILILIAFLILLKITVFLDRKTIKRMCALIIFTFMLSIIVFIEFYLSDLGILRNVRTVLMAIRYSATPLIIAMIHFTLVRKSNWHIFVPAFFFTVLNLISIPTGIVFTIRSDNSLQRGPLGYLPYIAVGLYSLHLIYVLFKQSNKLCTEIIPILFLCFACMSGMFLPFIFKKDYSKIFCTTIVIALFVYYVFSILSLTKKDPLTGLFNRQAYYSDIIDGAKDVSAAISIDMNGLKIINDTQGHKAGDEALVTLALCLLNATKSGQMAYRLGGDEFLILCRGNSEKEVKELIKRIEKNISETQYSCAIGYSYCADGSLNMDEMLTMSDKYMYESKKKYYERVKKQAI